MKKILFLFFVIVGCTNSNEKTENPVLPDNFEDSVVLDIEKMTSQNFELNEPNQISSELNFGQILFGAESSKKIILKNTSNQIKNISFTIEDNTQGFKLKLNRCESTLKPGKSCEITITFSSRGKENGSFATIFKVLDAPADLNLNLIASVVGNVSLDSNLSSNLVATLDEPFYKPGQNPGAQITRTLTITNNGPGYVPTVQYTVPSEYIIKLNRCGSLKVGKSCQIVLVYRNSRTSVPAQTSQSKILVNSSAGNVPVPPNITLASNVNEAATVNVLIKFLPQSIKPSQLTLTLQGLLTQISNLSTVATNVTYPFGSSSKLISYSGINSSDYSVDLKVNNVSANSFVPNSNINIDVLVNCSGSKIPALDQLSCISPPQLTANPILATLSSFEQTSINVSGGIPPYSFSINSSIGSEINNSGNYTAGNNDAIVQVEDTIIIEDSAIPTNQVFVPIKINVKTLQIFANLSLPTVSSYIGNYQLSRNLTIGNITYFSSMTAGNNLSLMRTDGTSVGTYPINSGNNLLAFDKNGIGTVNNKILFMANSVFDISISGLWVSDGSSNSATNILGPVVNSISYDDSYYHEKFVTTIDNKMFFTRKELFTQLLSLWVSDGTSNGTYLVKNIGGSSINDIIPYGNKVIFSHDDGVSGNELWVSDGTDSGTHIIFDINPGSGSSSPFWLTEFNGYIYFQAYTPSSGIELWRSDGTAVGTQRVLDLNPGPGGSVPENLIVSNNHLIFIANDGTNGSDVWSLDTSGNVTGLINVFINGQSRGNSNFPSIKVGNYSYLIVSSANNSGVENYKIVKTDGTISGTSYIDQNLVFETATNISSLTAVGTNVFFIGKEHLSPEKVYKYDGFTLSSFYNTNEISASNLFGYSVGEKYLFPSRTDLYGVEWYVSDGTNTNLLAGDMNRDTLSIPSYIMLSGNRLFFTNYDSINGYGLWLSTGQGTEHLIKDINPNSKALDFSLFKSIEYNNKLYFSATDGVNGMQLWVSDGTASGTYMVSKIGPGNSTSGPTSFNIIDNKLYFTQTNKTTGNAPNTLNVFDGSSVTTLFEDTSNTPGILTLFGKVGSGKILFSGGTLSQGKELYQTDGTVIGTSLLYELNDNSLSTKDGISLSTVSKIINGNLYFIGVSVQSGSLVSNIWTSDGTVLGTKPLNNNYGLSYSVNFLKDIYFIGNSLFFSINDKNIINNVSSEATVVYDLSNGNFSRYLQDLSRAIVLDNKFIKAFNFQNIGTELAIGDLSGLSLIKDILIGPNSSLNSASMQQSIKIGNNIYFKAASFGEGSELWRTDGTANGTFLVKNINPGPLSGIPASSSLKQFGNTIYFLGDDSEKSSIYLFK